jgi:hypothetical protein
MAISETYSKLILEQILLDLLLEGTPPTATEIELRFQAFIAENDLSLPLFDADNYHVEYDTPSSASKFNAANNDILRDMKVLYKHLFKVSDQAINNFDRWRAESNVLEGRLDDLGERINSLLLLSSDTAGFFNFMQDNFVDNSKVDLPNTDAYVNVGKGVVSIGTSSSGATRIDLSGIQDRDVEFTVLSRNNLVSAVSADGSRTRYAVSDVTNFWQERVYTSKPGPVTVELKINLQTKQPISRIDLDLHMANQNSTASVTPMYSVDNYNWKQLPVSNFTRSVIDKTTFQFTPVEAKWIKFIMTKVGYDQVHNELYIYEFGMDTVGLFNEGFSSTSSGSTLISKPLSVLGEDREIEEFSRVVLEVCEDVPDGTSIDYSVSAFNNENDPLGTFTAIDPLERKGSTKPSVIDFGELEPAKITGIGISYDPTESDDCFINPSRNFTLVQSIAGSTASTAAGVASACRYAFQDSNSRILDHSVASGVRVAQGTLELWRNVNTIGSTTKVRGISNQKQHWLMELRRLER